MRRTAGIASLALVLAQAPAFAQEADQSGAQSGAQTGTPAMPAPVIAAAPASTPEVQNPAILTIDQDELFARSRWGKRVHQDVERQSNEIAAENERLATQFSTEEEQLTALRDTLAPDEFRKRADEFDKRVVEVRRQRDKVARDLQDHVDEERAAFFRAALPVLAQVMKERGAVVVLDQRAVFVSAQSADVTALVIERLDAEIGEGPPPAEAQPAPEGAATPPEQTAP